MKNSKSFFLPDMLKISETFYHQESRENLQTLADNPNLLHWELKKYLTDVAFKGHHGFMKENGLKRCRSVLDIGTGRGYFLSKIAITNPNIEFTGIDMNSSMICFAKTYKMKNVRWETRDFCKTKDKL
jgi:tRNA G46 methylase TrmB